MTEYHLRTSGTGYCGWENTGSVLCIGNELSRSEAGTLWNARSKGNRCGFGRVGGINLIPVGMISYDKFPEKQAQFS